MAQYHPKKEKKKSRDTTQHVISVSFEFQARSTT